MSSPVVISAALTGVLATRELCPAIPYTPQEIGEEARRAADAGASIVHIHARNPEGGPEWRVETFAEILSEVRERTDVMGSMNYAIYSAKKKVFYQDHVFANPFQDILFFLEAMNSAGVRPELECFDTGHIANTAPLIDMGALKPPYQFSLIMGVLGGIPGTTRHLANQVETLPEGAHWQVIGVGLKQWALVAAAITMGGNVRVGLEDNFYLEEGLMAKSNGELVEKAARLARDLGRAVASIEEARRILGLGTDD